MEWEVQLIEWMQHDLGGFGSLLGKVFSFIGGETGLLLVALVLLFCWRKEVGCRLALMVAAVNTWLPMIKAAGDHFCPDTGLLYFPGNGDRHHRRDPL